MNDPYEGELFTFLADLFSDWSSPEARDAVWVFKRAMLQAVDYQSALGNVTVQRGYWWVQLRHAPADS